MAKTRGAHSLKQRVRQGPTPSVAGPFAAAGPSAAATGASPSVLAVRPSIVTASPAPSAVQSLAAGDAEGSSSMAAAQR